MKSERGQSRAGFTLVELLVVIGIIGVLVGILIPAVMKTQQASRRSRCLSQLRQVGLAMTMYLDLQGERAPFPNCAQMPTVTPEKPSLATTLANHIEGNQPVWNCPDDIYFDENGIQYSYFDKQGLSYEYPASRLAGLTREQARVDRSGVVQPSSVIVLVYDFDPVHGIKDQFGSRNALYLDGHADGL